MSDLRKEWAHRLAVLVAPDRVAEASEALSKIALMLDDDMPERCFTSKTALDAVASCKRRTIIPALADVRSALLGWLREHDTPSEGPEGWSTGDHAWMAYYRGRQMAGFPNVGDRTDKDPRANLLDLIGQQSPKCYLAITGAEYRKRDHVPYGALTAEQRDQLSRILGRTA